MSGKLFGHFTSWSSFSFRVNPLLSGVLELKILITLCRVISEVRGQHFEELVQHTFTRLQMRVQQSSNDASYFIQIEQINCLLKSLRTGNYAMIN